MKYDEDELAEAALLLAHHDPASRMPADLEKKILAQAAVVASEIRFTTTKAAAIAVEEPLAEPVPIRGSLLRTWGGWIAAAACFAFAVYEWRIETLGRAAAERAASTASSPPPSDSSSTAVSDIVLTAHPQGAAAKRPPVGRIHWDRATGAWQLTVADLASNGSGEQYRVWVSASDIEHAVPVGAFACTDDCKERILGLGAPLTRDTMKKVWLTRNGITDVATVIEPESIVGEGP